MGCMIEKNSLFEKKSNDETTTSTTTTTTTTTTTSTSSSNQINNNNNLNSKNLHNLQISYIDYLTSSYTSNWHSHKKKFYLSSNHNVNDNSRCNKINNNNIEYLDLTNYITTALFKTSNIINNFKCGNNDLSKSHNSYNIIRNSLSFYAASSVILVLCYLTSAAAAVNDHPIFDESSSDKEILDHLLQKSRYDKRLLPPVNRTLTVNVNVLLLSLASPDESSLKYEVEFLLNQQWNDPRLQYGNKSQYDYLNALHHHDNIWTPDTYFIMHGDFKDPLIPMHFALRIYRNGTITYAMRRHLILSCQGSLHIFPFDDPKCSFSMESISYELAQIKYVWKNDEDTLRKSPSLTTLNAYLIQNATVTCSVKSWRGNYSCLKVDLIFTRDRAFYFTTVFIPGIILVTSSFITFWLEWNAVPARSMIGVTTMLNFFTTSNGFRSTLPVVSNLTAMNVWDGVCMCFIYASLLEFVCVNYVGRKRPLHNVVYRPGENPVTQRLPAVLSRIGVILASPLEVIEQEFHAALSSEKANAPNAPPNAPTAISTSISSRTIPIPISIKTNPIEQIQNRNNFNELTSASNVVNETTTTTTPTTTATTVAKKSNRENQSSQTVTSSFLQTNLQITDNSDSDAERSPKKPPRLRKLRRSVSPNIGIEMISIDGRSHDTNIYCEIDQSGKLSEHITGEKKRDAGGPNEIVACTTCGGGNSPCTHSANNGCATETCFVQVRKKEPPHPIRVAKTIDVIARITFPTAYAIFLIFFFVHYKGFS